MSGKKTTKRAMVAALFPAALAAAFFFWAYDGGAALPGQPAGSERALRLDLPGLPNLYRVSDGLYRSGQPQAAGVSELKKLGIRTVVNLSHDRDDECILAGSGITQVRLPMHAFFPKSENYRRFLQIAADPVQTPVLVHCRHGSDRTGAAVALYRIHIQKWPAAEAIAEMVSGPFGFHRIHSHLKRFVRRFKP